MRCTRCSEAIHPVVCLDIDGTLGDYHGHFQNFARQWLGGQDAVGNPYTGTVKYSEWFCDEFGVDLTTFRQIKLAYRQGGLKRTMPVYLDAAYLCDTLAVLGAEVWLTTTRPYLSLEGIDRDTREWLYRNKIQYSRLLYDEQKYEVVADRVDPARVVAALDDEAEQCESANKCFGAGVAIQRGNAYNGGAKFAPRITPLSKATLVIANRVTEWRKTHG